MYVVYVAGPFRGATHWSIVNNVRHAEFQALKVWRAGHVAFCPHLNTANFQGACPDQVWLDGDLEILKRCDVMWAIPGWDTSKGTLREIEVAKAQGIPVYFEWGKLRRFLNGNT